MATVTVNISATDNMSPVIAALQAQLNQLQQSANINLGGRMGQSANQMMNYTTRLFENMLNSLGTKLWKQFTNNLKSAYEEIKAIDDELVVVRRVTGKTSKELEGMSKNAMKVAQTYGVSASKYLSGVADFTRAGYKDQAEGLAELSVKLQRSGDVSADVANQYILAIDKAYGLQGNIEALTAAMDGANQIGNEYATNVAEISAGMGKIATIASTAHIGINELTAALGTITAVTQRSGTEAATALRAIFLNIMGDTTTEIEDGAKWTAGEIEGLRDVLELYAPEVVRAAEATGTLINPMEAIGALAKSYQAGILTESKLFSMVNDIGGKLRTNQLMVLIKNWDMYESMLNTFANASGSIDREVANSLDSITVKTEQLKASWVALVNDSLSTAMIKGFLDGMNTAVKSVGNLGNALTIVLGLVTALKAQRLATLFAGMIGRDAAWVTGATGAFRNFGLAITAVGVAISVVNGIIQSHNESMEKSQKSALESGKKAQQSSAEILTLYSAYVSAKQGTEQYTVALHALAEALGLTANEADNAKTNIKALTTAKLAEAMTTSKAALEEWSANQRKKIGIEYMWSPVYTQGMPSEMLSIMEEFKDIAEDAGFSIHLDAFTGKLDYFSIPKLNEGAEELITHYETALKLKEQLDRYGTEAGIDLQQFHGYSILSTYLRKGKDIYDEAKAMMTSYADTVAAHAIRTMPGIDEMMMGDLDKTDVDTLREYAKVWEETISKITDSSFQGRGKWIRESLIGMLKDQFPQIYNEWLRITNTPGGDGMAKGADKAASSVNKLTAALSNATKAKTAFDAAMERDAENKGFADYQSAYATYAEEIEAGRVNSQKAMAAARYLMAGSGTDFDTLYREKGYKGVNAFMANGPYKTMYGDAEKTYGEGFLAVLAKIADKKTGEIKLNDKVVASYKKVNGQIEFTVSDLQGLAEATHLSIDQTWDAIKALGVYGDLESDVKNFTAQLKEMGKAAGFAAETEEGLLTIDYDKLLAFAENSGMGSSEWMQMKEWLYLLNEIGEVEIQGVPDVEGGWQNYADYTEKMEDATEHAAEDAQTVREELSNAAQIAAESTPEALGLPVDVSGYENVTEQVASMNAYLDQMRLNGNAEGADKMLARMQAAAEAAGGSLEMVEGKITAIKDASGNDADWEYLRKLINNSGMATAAQTPNGLNIFENDGTTYKISFEVDQDGTAQMAIDKILAGAEAAAETRTIQFDSTGKVNNIDVIDTTLANITQRKVGFYTDGTLRDADLFEWNMDTLTKDRHVTFTTDGQIENIQDVEFIANQAGRIRDIYYKTNGQVANLSITDANANSVLGVREIEYSANGDMLNAMIVILEETANGPTQTVRMIHYDGDIEKFNNKADQVVVTAEEKANAASNKAVINVTGNDDGAVETLDEVEKSVVTSTGAVNSGEFGTYDLEATTDGVKEGVAAAQKLIADSINTTDESYHYHLSAVFDDDPFTGSLFALSPILNPSSPLNTGSPDPTKGRSLKDMYAGIELKVTADESSAKSAAEEASSIVQANLGQNPAELPVAGIKLSEDSFMTEDGTMVYTAQFQVEDSDAVMDIITEIDKAAGTVHRVKIVTEGDGTQIIDEFFGDTQGNGKHTTLTIDAEGNAYTELESIEELQEFIERTISFSVNANVSDSQSKLNRLKTTLEGIKNKTITVTTNTKSPSGGVLEGLKDLFNLPKAANGASNFKGGYALINEEGPELVAGNGLAQIYANGFPTIAKIPNGATIYTAKETASLLGGKMSIPAYADGTNGGNNFMDLVGGFFGKMFGDSTKLTMDPLPDKKQDEEEKKSEREEWEQSHQGSQTKSSEDGEEADFWDIIRKYIDYGLKKIQYQIDSYQDDITAIERARDELLKPIEEELEDLDYSLSMLQYEVTLLERARDDAIKPLNKEIERLEKERDINKENIDLEEKRQALEDARHQRTIRYFNEETGQWEWMADAKAIKEAEEAYADALADFEITTLKRERDAIEDQYKEQIEALEDQEEVIERKQEDLEHERTKIEYEYGESIDPLQDALDKLQQTYDDLDKYYQRLVDAVEVPLESLTDALQKMMGAGENYVAQMEGTVKLLDALYALAPTWDAITVGDIGKYSPEQGKYGSYSSVDQSTTIIVDGITIDGSDAKTMTDILGRHRLYRNR